MKLVISASFLFGTTLVTVAVLFSLLAVIRLSFEEKMAGLFDKVEYLSQSLAGQNKHLFLSFK